MVISENCREVFEALKWVFKEWNDEADIKFSQQRFLKFIASLKIGQALLRTWNNSRWNIKWESTV